jgi:WhiB family redox-sensing transcriptional regulator
MTQNWRHRAACRTEDPELFFPTATENTPYGQEELADAKAVCQRCPVISTCLVWALESGQEFGVWGGLSEGERRALKHKAHKTREEVRTS